MAGAAASDATTRRRDTRFRGIPMRLLPFRRTWFDAQHGMRARGTSSRRKEAVVCPLFFVRGYLSAWDRPPRDRGTDLCRLRDVAVAQIAASRSVRDIVGLQRRETVVPGQFGLLLQPVKPRRVAAEDRRLDRAVGR